MTDECASRGASGNCGVDVNNSRAIRFESHGDFDRWVLELDFSLAIERNRTRTRAQCDLLTRLK